MHQPRNIVVIEASPTYRNLQEACLSGLGYGVKVTDSAREGLEWIANEDPDLVLFSTNLKDMDPLSLQLRMKTHPETAMVLTAGSHEDADIATAERNGLKNILQKPFDFEVLQRKVEGLIGPALKRP